jgi:hypothetical protein
MTVQELINILQNLDPEEVVMVQHPALDETVSVWDVRLGGPAGNVPVIEGDWL